MKSDPHISLFLTPTSFSAVILPQLMEGFREAGFAVSGNVGLLDEAGATRWMAEKRPDVVFEYNRPRNEAAFWPSSVKHICWIVDMVGRTEHQMRGSDIFYFFTAGQLGSYPYNDVPVGLFQPAVCPKTFYPTEASKRSYVTDFVFIGHMTRPWSAEDLARNVSVTDKPLSFGDLLPIFSYEYYNTRFLHRQDIRDTVDRIVREHTRGPMRDDSALVYDILDRLPRMERHAMLKEMVEISPPGHLYGTDGMKAWEDLKDHYRGYLEDPNEIRRVYQTAKATLHNGVLEHFRTFEAMRCGCLVMYFSRPHNHAPFRKDPEAIRLFKLAKQRQQFTETPGTLKDKIDYIPYFLGDVTGNSREQWLDNHAAEVDKIRESAYEKVTKYHTWACRGRMVMQDLQKL